jgi:hypothetical protein
MTKRERDKWLLATSIKGEIALKIPPKLLV